MTCSYVRCAGVPPQTAGAVTPRATPNTIAAARTAAARPPTLRMAARWYRSVCGLLGGRPKSQAYGVAENTSSNSQFDGEPLAAKGSSGRALLQAVEDPFVRIEVAHVALLARRLQPRLADAVEPSQSE